MAPRIVGSLNSALATVNSLKEVSDVKDRKKVFKKLPSKKINQVNSVFAKLVGQKGRYKLGEEDRSHLISIFKPHKRSIRGFLKRSPLQRRKLIQSGGFITALIAATIPLIGELLTHLLRKYI